MKYKSVEFTIDYKFTDTSLFYSQESLEKIAYKNISNPFNDKKKINEHFVYKNQDKNVIKYTHKNIEWYLQIKGNRNEKYTYHEKESAEYFLHKPVDYKKMIYKTLCIRFYKVKLKKKKLQKVKYQRKHHAKYRIIKTISDKLDVLKNNKGEICNHKATILVNMNNCANFSTQIFELKKHFKVIDDFQDNDFFYIIDNRFAVYKKGGLKGHVNGIMVDKIRDELKFEYIIRQINIVKSQK